MCMYNHTQTCVFFNHNQTSVVVFPGLQHTIPIREKLISTTLKMPIPALHQATDSPKTNDCIAASQSST